MRINNFENISRTSLTSKIIAFPTDTVFGIGAIINDLVGIDKIYELKERDSSKPLAILAGSIEDILPYIEKPTEELLNIMKKHWPGALTIVFKKTDKVPNVVTRGLDTVAFRIPNNPDALKLLSITGPLATTSVNKSGEAPLNTFEAIEDMFGDKIDYLYTKNYPSSNVSSTIIDVTGEEIKVLRQGEISV